jgi:hypothetical protein
MLKSTGHQLLDTCSLKALKSWRLKSGLRREIDVPVIHALARTKSTSDAGTASTNYRSGV